MRSLSLCMLFLALCLVSTSAPRAGAPTYELVEVNVPGAEYSVVRRVNNRGQVLVVGSFPVPDDDSFVNRSYRWEKDELLELKPARKKERVEAIDLGENGKAIGTSSFSIDGRLINRPVIWKSSKPRQLPAPRSEKGLIPLAIGPTGLVSGTTSQTRKVWTVKGKRFAWLDIPFAAASARVRSINASEVMVGGAEYEDPAGELPVIWENRRPFELQLPDGYSAGSAQDINASGDVVGFAGQPGTQANSVPLIWRKDRKPVILGSFGGDRGGATSINNRGQVVGASRIEGDGATTHGFLWTEAGGMVDVNDLLSPQDQAAWEIEGASSINDAGWMIVQARARKGPSNNRSFLLRPKS